MSSDLPDMRFDSGIAMARVLVTYMGDARAVRSRIREEFEKSPAITTIERMRADYLASKQRPDERPWKAHEGHRPDEVYQKLIEANERFLDALKWERQRSLALRSTYLTDAKLIGYRWNKAVAEARKDAA